MKTKRLLFVSLCLTMWLCGQLIAQKHPVSRISSPNANKAVYGKTTGHIYTNSVIGLKITLPQELEIQEPSYVDLKLIPTQVPESIFAGQTLIVKSLIDGVVPPVEFICTAMRLPGNSMSASAEQVLNDPLFRRPSDLKARTEKLGNNLFAYVDSSTPYVNDRVYAYVRNGYYVTFLLRYKASDDLDVMRQTLAEADLDWNGK